MIYFRLQIYFLLDNNKEKIMTVKEYDLLDEKVLKSHNSDII